MGADVTGLRRLSVEAHATTTPGFTGRPAHRKHVLLHQKGIISISDSCERKTSHVPDDARKALERMPFILTRDRDRSAIDPDTSARMVINRPPAEGVVEVKFTAPGISLRLMLSLRQKFPERRVWDATNPGIMINAGNLNFLLSRGRQFANFDFDRKTQFVESLIRMMAFINKHYPLGPAAYFWSDYEDYVSGRKGVGAQFVFRMPSDEELLRFSIEAK
jgi:hypothetical protein